MQISAEDGLKYRVLLVDPDEDRAREIRLVLGRMGLETEHVSSHLKAVALTEDAVYPCLLVAAQGEDLSGLEFCTLLRAREARRQDRSAYVLMLGAKADLVPILSADAGVDAYLIDPWMDLELQWKLERALRMLRLTWDGAADRLADPATGLLTPDGLKTFLFEEVNRVGRRQGWLSLSVLSIPDQADLRVSFGEDWLAWFMSGIWAYARRQLRSYDRLAALDSGLLCLVAPDQDEPGTRALLARLDAALAEYQFREPARSALRLRLSARFLCVRVLGDYKQFGRTGELLWDWLRDQVSQPVPEGVQGSTGQVALDLELAADPGSGSA